MSINSVLSAGTNQPVGTNNNSRTTNNDSGLDINDFLKLLIAQLSNQDPLGGGSSGGSSSGTDYISQLAQFTMLQQISTLTSNLSTTQAYGLIGKYVYLTGENGEDMTFGKVDGVVKEKGINYLMVGGEMYDMSKVYAVADEDNSVAIDDQLLSSAHLIGKQVTAKVINDDKVESTVSGTVEKIRIQNGVIYLVIGGKEIELSSVTEISDTQPAEQTL